jgi:ABC-2 type transport system permease protein
LNERERDQGRNEGAIVRNAVVMAIKDLHLLWRDKFALFWVAVFPLMMALFVGAIFGGSGPPAGMSVAVVDLDSTGASRAFIETLDRSDAIRLAAPHDGTPYTRDVARQAVAAGDVTAYLLVPSGYEAATPMLGQAGPTLELGIDPARRAESGYLQGLVVKAALERFRENLGVPSFEPVHVQLEPVLREARRPPNAFALSFPQAMSWGIIGCCATFAVGLVQERTRGTYGRLRMAPNPAWTILAGKALACFTACVSATLLLVALGMFLGVTVGSWPALAAIVVSLAFGFTGFMMLVSTMGRTEQSVSGAGWALMMPLAMIGGSMVPQMVMPAWLLRISNFSPVKWMILGVEGAMWRGFSMSEMVLPCAILLGFGLVCFTVGAVVITRRSW